MKILLHLLAISLLIVVPTVAENAPTNSSASLLVPQRPPVPNDPNAITPADMQELRLARDAALKANPQLGLDQEKLSQDLHAFLIKLNAAVLKTDPNVAPIINRMQPAGARPMPPPIQTK